MSIGSYARQSASEGMITLQPSAVDLQAFKDFAAVVPKAAAAAQRRAINKTCLLYTSPSPRDQRGSRMPSSA